MKKQPKLQKPDISVLSKIYSDRALTRSDAIEYVREQYYDKETETDKIENRLRKIMDKLTSSGCVKRMRDIGNFDGRSSLYVITEKGKDISEYIDDNNHQVLDLNDYGTGLQ
jgi:DNA-binding MarR family transcriptional regulator